MTEIELNGTIYRWELVGGGKGLVIENKYIKRPYCMITFENESLINEPEEMVKRILGVLFAERLTKKKIIKVKEKFETEKNEIAAIKNNNGKYYPICNVCGRPCKSKAGLRAHSRSHKLKTKKGGK